MAQKKKVAKKVQRTQRPAYASKKSLGIQVLILFILFQLVSLLTVQISGRGTAYLYMMLPLMIITYGGWLCVNRMHADVPFFLATLTATLVASMLPASKLMRQGRTRTQGLKPRVYAERLWYATTCKS